MPKDSCLVLFAAFDLAYRIGGLVEQNVEQTAKASCSGEAWKGKKYIYPACGHIIACLSNNLLQYFVIGCVRSLVK